MSETEIKRNILLWMSTQKHIMAWNHPTGVARALQPPHQVISYGMPGVPDIIGVALLPCPACGAPVGRALGVEVKAPGGRQSEVQARFAAEWRRCGGLYIVAKGIADLSDICVEDEK